MPNLTKKQIQSLADVATALGQLTLDLAVVESKEQAEQAAAPARIMIGDMKLGLMFSRRNNYGNFIRVRPTYFLLNSTLVQENLARGNVLIMNVEKFTIFFVEGSEEALPSREVKPA